MLSILFKAIIKFIALLVLWSFAVKSYPRYETMATIACVVIGIKFIFDIFTGFSGLKDQKDLIKTAKNKPDNKPKLKGKKRIPFEIKPALKDVPKEDDEEKETKPKKIGKYLSLIEGSVLYEFDGVYIKDTKGLVLYIWDGKYLTTGIGKKLYELEGNYIKQVYGSKLYEYDGKFIKKLTGSMEYEWDGKLIKQCKSTLKYKWDGDDFPIIMAIIVLITDHHITDK